MGEVGSGFTIEELHKMKDYFGQSHIVQLALFEEGDQKGAVLIVRQYVKSTEHAELFREMNGFEWDTKYYDTRYDTKPVLDQLSKSFFDFSIGLRYNF